MDVIAGAVARTRTDVVPLLSSGDTTLLLLRLGVLLLVAVCLGWLARRIGLPAIVGEVAAGVVLGPSLLGAVGPDWLRLTDPGQARLMDGIAQVGVVLLVGVTGGQLDLKAIGRRGRVLTGISVGGLAVPFALGIAIGFVVPHALWGPRADRTSFVLFLGLTLCVSAIPVIAKTLSELKMVHRDIGQLILAAAAIDGLVAWLMLPAVSVLVGRSWRPTVLLTALLGLVAFIGAAILIGRPLVRLVLRLACRSDSALPVNATCVTIILLCSAVSQALGFEAVFGALVAGVLIGTADVVPAGRLAPLNTIVLAVFAPIFLVGVGLRMDIGQLGRPAWLLIAVAVLAVAMIGKLVGVYGGARLGRLGHWESVALGAGLNSRGLVEVVVATTGLQIGVFNPVSFTIIVLVAVFTSAVASPLLRWSMARVEYQAAERERFVRMAAWTERPEPVEQQP